jgi:transcription elongation factor Elf1
LEGLYLVAERRGVGMIKCPNCGSTAQVKLKEIFQADKYVQITWVCGCGTEQVTRMSYEEYAQGKWKGSE